MISCGGTSGGPGPVGSVGPIGGDEEGITGSGNTTSETRELAAFDRVVFSSEGTVVLSQTETASLSIEADDNLHQYLITEVTDGELTISTTANTDIVPSRPIAFRVTLAAPTRIELAGAGTIKAERLDVGAITIVLSGTGDILVDQLEADEVTARHTGVGTIRLSGETQRQTVVASGVGDYDGTGLVSGRATVEASGLANAIISVSDELDIVASDSATVSYYGSPRIAQTVTGAAEVQPLEGR